MKKGLDYNKDEPEPPHFSAFSHPSSASTKFSTGPSSHFALLREKENQKPKKDTNQNTPNINTQHTNQSNILVNRKGKRKLTYISKTKHQSNTRKNQKLSI
jgi:hypothetical protein